MYYSLIIIAVVMFGINFALQDVYQKMRGDSLRVSLEATIIGSIAAFVVILFINKFSFEYTHYTLFIASVLAGINIGFTFFSFKALGRINLSLYSLFSMLGGMLLPFLQGIIFYNEDLTIAKILCLVIIVISLLLTIEKGNGKKDGVFYYLGIFILNGMCGVINKIFTSSNLPKTSAEGLNMWVAITSIVISAVLLFAFFIRKKEEKPINLANSSVIAISGTVSRIANLLLVIALFHVDTSVQYPMVTGGVMIVSTIISFLRRQKPSIKEILSVSFAFIAMLVLFVVPV